MNSGERPKCRDCGAIIERHPTYGWVNIAYQGVCYATAVEHNEATRREIEAGRGYANCDRLNPRGHRPVQTLAEDLIDLGVEW